MAATIKPFDCEIVLGRQLTSRIRELAFGRDRTFEQQVRWLIHQGFRRQEIEDQATELLLAGWPLVQAPPADPAPDNVAPFRPRPRA